MKISRRSFLRTGVSGLLFLLGCKNGAKPERNESKNRILQEGTKLLADSVNKDGNYEIYKVNISEGSYAIVRPLGEDSKQYFGKQEFVLAWFARDFYTQRGQDVDKMPGYQRWMVAEENNLWKKTLKSEMIELYKRGDVVPEARVFK